MISSNSSCFTSTQVSGVLSFSSLISLALSESYLFDSMSSFVSTHTLYSISASLSDTISSTSQCFYNLCKFLFWGDICGFYVFVSYNTLEHPNTKNNTGIRNYFIFQKQDTAKQKNKKKTPKTTYVKPFRG